MPLTAVAMATNFSSSTSISCPSAREQRARPAPRWSSVVSGVAYQTVMPRPSWAGVLGMLRTTWSWPSTSASAARGGAGDDRDHQLAAAQARPRARARRGQHLRLDRQDDDVGRVGRLACCDATARMPYSRSSSSRRSARGWLATICAGSTISPRSRPAIIASAITPEPTVAIVRPRGWPMVASIGAGQPATARPRRKKRLVVSMAAARSRLSRRRCSSSAGA